VHLQLPLVMYSKNNAVKRCTVKIRLDLKSTAWDQTNLTRLDYKPNDFRLNFDLKGLCKTLNAKIRRLVTPSSRFSFLLMFGRVFWSATIFIALFLFNSLYKVPITYRQLRYYRCLSGTPKLQDWTLIRRMCGQLTESKFAKFHSSRRFSLRVFETYALLVLRCY